MRTTIICSGLAFLALALAAGVQAAAGSHPTLRAAPAVVERGSALTLSGSGWPAGSAVRLLAGPLRSEAEPIRTVRAANGSFRAVLPIAAAATPGSYLFLACLDACRVKATAAVTIVVSRAQALALVRKAATAKAGACGFTIAGLGASLYTRPVAGWRVDVRLRFSDHADTARWNVVGAKAVPGDPLAGEIAAGCP